MRSGSKKETPKTAIHMCFDTEYCGNKEVQLSNFYKRQDLGTCVPSGKFTLDNKAGEIVTVPLKVVNIISGMALLRLARAKLQIRMWCPTQCRFQLLARVKIEVKKNQHHSYQ